MNQVLHVRGWRIVTGFTASEKEVSSQASCTVTLYVLHRDKEDIIVADGYDIDDAFKQVFQKALLSILDVNLNGSMPALSISGRNWVRAHGGNAYQASATGPKGEKREATCFQEYDAVLERALLKALKKALFHQGINLSLPF